MNKPTTIARSVLGLVTVSMVRLPSGQFEVAALDSGYDDAAPGLRTSDEAAARAHFAGLVDRFDLFAKYWRGSVSESVCNAIRTGNVRTVTL